jgi:hypothetical protein
MKTKKFILALVIDLIIIVVANYLSTNLFLVIYQIILFAIIGMILPTKEINLRNIATFILFFFSANLLDKYNVMLLEQLSLNKNYFLALRVLTGLVLIFSLYCANLINVRKPSS